MGEVHPFPPETFPQPEALLGQSPAVPLLMGFALGAAGAARLCSQGDAQSGAALLLRAGLQLCSAG